MPQTYTVKEVQGSQDGSFTNKQSGEFVSLTDYKLVVTNPAGQDGVVILQQKPESDAPTVGQTIDGETTPIKGGPLKGMLKLKKAPPPGQFNNGGGFSGGGAPAQSNDLDRQDSIERQVAAKVAGQLLSGSGNLAQFEQTANAVREWIKGQPLAAPVQQNPTGTPAADTSELGGPAHETDGVPF